MLKQQEYHAIDAIWQDLKDIKGFEKDCKIGKSLGYVGKSHYSS